MQEAVSSGFEHFFNWKGRASRPAFWWLWLAQIVALLVAFLIDSIVGLAAIPQGLVGLIFLFPLLSATVRRLHDTNRTGWWWWIGIIPVIGTIVMIIFLVSNGDEGENRYGPNPGSGVSAPSGGAAQAPPPADPPAAT